MGTGASEQCSPVSLPIHRCPGQRLHQRQLHRRLPQAERLYRHPGPTARNHGRLLADGVGAAHSHRGHDDAAGGEVPGKTVQGLPGGAVGNTRPPRDSGHLVLPLGAAVPQGTCHVLFSWGITVMAPRHWRVPRMLICCTRCRIFWERWCVPQLLACSRNVDMFPRCQSVPGALTHLLS